MPDVFAELMDRQEHIDEQDERGYPGPLVSRRIHPHAGAGHVPINSRQISALAGLRSAMPNDLPADVAQHRDGLLVMLPNERVYWIDAAGKTERLSP